MVSQILVAKYKAIEVIFIRIVLNIIFVIVNRKEAQILFIKVNNIRS